MPEKLVYKIGEAVKRVSVAEAKLKDIKTKRAPRKAGFRKAAITRAKAALREAKAEKAKLERQLEIRIAKSMRAHERTRTALVWLDSIVAARRYTV